MVSTLYTANVSVVQPYSYQEPVNQGSDSNSFAGGLASGTQRSIFRINWRKSILFEPCKFFSKSSSDTGGISMTPIHLPEIRLAKVRDEKQV
jgi:hypothetical protein